MCDTRDTGCSDRHSERKMGREATAALRVEAKRLEALGRGVQRSVGVVQEVSGKGTPVLAGGRVLSPAAGSSTPTISSAGTEASPVCAVGTSESSQLDIRNPKPLTSRARDFRKGSCGAQSLAMTLTAVPRCL